ncbi:hypothetical protein BD779DRAFT_1508421 [Infundibulicybe gibba]|nr:hypothetical protein BD779DRAFT_1508421 [Infundibulicybe gibba]
MSVIKLSCIWAATLGLHVSSTPPSPSPSKEKSAPIFTNRSLWERIIFSEPSRAFARTSIWAVAIAETAAIIAGRDSSKSKLSRYILAALLQNGNPRNLDIRPLRSLGLALTMFGCLFRVYCYRVMGPFFIFDWKIQQDHKLITHGPYSIVRHPAYSGLLFESIGMILWYGSRGSFLRESGTLDGLAGRMLVATFVAIRLTRNCLLARGMVGEDKALRQKFGDEWDVWARRVPYRLIPGVL